MKNPVDIRFIVPDGSGGYCFANPEERSELANRSIRQFLIFIGIYQVGLLLNQWLFDEVSPVARFLGHWIPSVAQVEHMLGRTLPLVPSQIAIAFILCVVMSLYWVALEDSAYQRLKVLERLRPTAFGLGGRIFGALFILILCAGVCWFVRTPFDVRDDNFSADARFFRDMLSGYRGLATSGAIVSYSLAVVLTSGLLMVRLLVEMVLDVFGKS